ncbi:hypothetical protein B0H67DRAFT_558370 [Lasiosphaeris hirsuta]|uniref:Uncharacterized protein n=1 Tax=Lasiosphaeris hirsuta TaxID=260670 RepID=A0AA40DJ82_9PEZI|nr:hypothetical protein B0H67DRAFT_558370 [Lasiosphaeris hirsuta]
MSSPAPDTPPSQGQSPARQAGTYHGGAGNGGDEPNGLPSSAATTMYSAQAVIKALATVWQLFCWLLGVAWRLGRSGVLWHLVGKMKDGVQWAGSTSAGWGFAGMLFRKIPISGLASVLSTVLAVSPNAMAGALLLTAAVPSAHWAAGAAGTAVPAARWGFCTYAPRVGAGWVTDWADCTGMHSASNASISGTANTGRTLPSERFPIVTLDLMVLGFDTAMRMAADAAEVIVRDMKKRRTHPLEDQIRADFSAARARISTLDKATRNLTTRLKHDQLALVELLDEMALFPAEATHPSQTPGRDVRSARQRRKTLRDEAKEDQTNIAQYLEVIVKAENTSMAGEQSLVLAKLSVIQATLLTIYGQAVGLNRKLDADEKALANLNERLVVLKGEVVAWPTTVSHDMIKIAERKLVTIVEVYLQSVADRYASNSNSFLLGGEAGRQGWAELEKLAGLGKVELEKLGRKRNPGKPAVGSIPTISQRVALRWQAAPRAAPSPIPGAKCSNMATWRRISI